MATAPGERVISAAAQGFGAMFSHMCSFCSGDLPVPLSPSLKRNNFKIIPRPLKGQSQGRALQGKLSTISKTAWQRAREHVEQDGGPEAAWLEC